MTTVEIKLPFGINKNNILVHVVDVENGKECGCVCPEQSCRSPLIAANKGKKVQPHFRHVTDNKCDGGLESAIHLTAKQILMESKQIKLPQCISSISKRDSKGREHLEEEIVVAEGTTIGFDSVKDEYKLTGVRPDILAKKGDSQLIIEIFFRHQVGEEKLIKIKEANISAIEIDLSDLTLDHVKDMATFRECIINDPRRIKWLYNTKARHSVYLKLEKRLSKKIEMQEKIYDREDSGKRMQEKIEKEKLLQALSELEKLRSSGNLILLKRKAENHYIWKRRKKYMPFSWGELPFFVNADVPDGDWIFGCDRRIWQAVIYSSIIFKGSGNFSDKWVNEWLQSKVGFKVPNSVQVAWDKCNIIRRIYYPRFPPAYVLGNLPSSQQTLEKYFFYLCEVGILEYSKEDPRHPGCHWFKVISKEVKPDFAITPGAIGANGTGFSQYKRITLEQE